MATEDLTVGGDGSGRPISENRSFTIRKTVDFNENNYSASDVLQLIAVKAGWFVKRVSIDVETVEDSAGNVNVGDATDVDGYLATVDLTALGVSVTTSEAYNAGKLYAADDTIDMIPSANVDAGKVTVIAEILDCNAE